MKTKIKRSIRKIILTGAGFLFFFAANNTMAITNNILVNDDENIMTLLDDFLIETEQDSAGPCILNAALSGIADFSVCEEDSACIASTLFMMAIDILVCANPEDSNMAFIACLSDAVMEMLELGLLCDGDHLCLIQNILPVVLNIISCKTE